MTRALVATGFAVVLALSGCKPTPPGPKKSGPAVAQGEGVVVTVAEFQARLDEQSPFLRQRYQNLDRKKEFLDSLVKFEILANAAQKEGYQNDPDVQLTMKKAMVQKLVQKRFGDGDAKDITDADVQKFYDEHKDDFVKPVRVRTSALLVAATEKDRAQKGAQAKKLLAQVKASSKKDPQAFQALVRSILGRRRQQGQRRRPGLPLRRTSTRSSSARPSRRPPSPPRTARRCSSRRSRASGLSAWPAGRRGSPAPSTR